VEVQSKAIVGLTGGIASGKSAVARELRELGVQVVDADQLAREVVAPGTEGLAEVALVFGKDVLNADGSLHRELLGQRVFDDPDARKRLNAITHPRIAQLSAERIAAALHTSSPYVVYEAALLVETGSHRGMSALVVVAADPAVQLKRIVARDGLDEVGARARLAAQAPLEVKLAVADYVIRNDAGLPELKAEVNRVHNAILARFPAQPSAAPTI